MKQVFDDETAKILELAEGCLKAKGDFVELGCYEGDTSLLLSELLKKSGSEKKLWIYDSFEGLPEKGVEDFSVAGEAFKRGELAVSKREVKARFLRANLPVPIIKKGWFEELKDDDLPKEICFGFLDGDLYSSIKVSLGLVAPRLVEKGIMIVHDYNNPELPGVTKAVDEFLEKNGWKMEKYRSLAILQR